MPGQGVIPVPDGEDGGRGARARGSSPVDVNAARARTGSSFSRAQRRQAPRAAIRYCAGSTEASDAADA
jgi:hypothetical protein